MKIVFLGTPDFALPSLQALADSTHEIVGVITQPDRLRDRGRAAMPPVKELATQLGLPVFQFEKIRIQGVETLRALSPDLMVTCAYGQIISQEILDIPPKGVINVHGSLLPKYRGASPVQWAILNGETQTGITIMRTALGVDSGDVLLQRKTPVGQGETSGELFDRLAVMGAEALMEAVDIIQRGEDRYTPQDETQATHCRMLVKEDGKLDFSKPASVLVRQIAAMNPWPSAYCYRQGKLFKIWKAEESEAYADCAAGTVSIEKDRAYVACGAGSIRLIEVQAEGKKRMPVERYLIGANLQDKEVLE